MANDPRSTYDTVARDYAATFGELAEADRELVGAVAEQAVRIAGPGAPVIDVGSGPGDAAAHLATFGTQPRGFDLAPGMVTVARERHPHVTFDEADMRDLPLADASIAGAVYVYSILHMPPEERLRALEEAARVLMPGAALLVSFHTHAEGHAAGSVLHTSEWWGHDVALDGWFIDPSEVIGVLTDRGLRLTSHTTRGPATSEEFPSQRAWLLFER